MPSVEDQLCSWEERSSKITALFSGAGLSICVPGFVKMLRGENKLCLVDEHERLLMALPLSGLAPLRFEPLLDAPEELVWKIDFIVGVEFVTPCGTLGLYETAD
jgi:hypothetical protein